MKVIDTSVAIDHMRGHPPAVALFQGLLDAPDRLVSSEVIRFELLAGVRAGDGEALEEFCLALDWLPVTEEVVRRAANLAVRYRGSHSGIDDIDYLLAATAQLLDAELLTTNVRHFPMLSELRPPY